jgi:hypothetical protein
MSQEFLNIGEIDFHRDRKFKNCMRKEIKAKNIAERNKVRNVLTPKPYQMFV